MNGIITILYFVYHNRELISTEAGDCIFLSQAKLQASGHADQELISHRMAQAVVDLFEVVNIQE